jgi:uncharacterized protein YjbI with pentapeptide repeats
MMRPMTTNQNSYFAQQEEKIKEDSKTLRNSYISYLSLAAFVWMIVESITHRQLLIPDESIKLPLFGLDIPVTTFFALAPVILLLFYSYFLIHAVRLAKALEQCKKNTKEKNWESRVQGSLFTWYFLEPEDGSWVLKKLTSAFVFLSFWCLVPFILLRTQWQFLPYHSEPLIFLHQLCLLLSLLLAIYFSRYTRKLKIFTKNRTWPKKLQSSLAFIGITFSILLMETCSWTILIIPASIEENESAVGWYQISFNPTEKTLNSETAGQNNPIISVSYVRNLNLPETLLAKKPSDALIAKFAGENNESQKLLKYYGTLDLQGRDLRFAIFSSADLRKSDLRYADLQGADLFDANLQGTNLFRANLQGANLSLANLQGAKLSSADLQGAKLSSADLYGADLSDADLQGTNLPDSDLQGTNLSHANLQGANLSHANLQGANLSNANLQGTDLSHANLQGAKLSSADLYDADLDHANLQGADFRLAELGKFDFSNEELDEWAKSFPENRRKRFVERMQYRNGKDTNFNLAKYQSLCHSDQQWFRGPETGDEKPCLPRQEIYREKLLCEFPVLINQQNNKKRPLFNKEELREIVKEKCPQHLGRISEN